MATLYSWTSGPVASSAGMDHIYIVLFNPTGVTRKVFIRVYDLGFTPKQIALGDEIEIRPEGSVFITVPLPELLHWEVRYSAYSRQVKAYVAGRQGSINLPGNTVLGKEFMAV